MNFTIAKRFAFAASHQLPGLPDGHQCGRLHGHNYVAVLELASPDLNLAGMVFDFGELKGFRNYIDEQLDHRHLNDVIKQPTAELLAAHLLHVADRMYPGLVLAVTVEETPTSWVRVSR